MLSPERWVYLFIKWPTIGQSWTTYRPVEENRPVIIIEQLSRSP
uniref:Uncharacterized protein n=1 Tax=Anguilla anguilla TaxID=7936 RepID=A0A0E9QTV4_ANGAN